MKDPLSRGKGKGKNNDARKRRSASVTNPESRSDFANELIVRATKKRMTEKDHFQTQKKCSFMYEKIASNLQALKRMEAMVQNPAEVLKDSLISKVSNINNQNVLTEALKSNGETIMNRQIQVDQFGSLINNKSKRKIDVSSNKTVKAISDYIIDVSKT